jgi:hypothetical protein
MTKHKTKLEKNTFIENQRISPFEKNNKTLNLKVKRKIFANAPDLNVIRIGANALGKVHFAHQTVIVIVAKIFNTKQSKKIQKNIFLIFLLKSILKNKISKDSMGIFKGHNFNNKRNKEKLAMIKISKLITQSKK